MSISRWFTPPHLGFLCTVIEMTTQLITYFCHFTKGEYIHHIDLRWLEGKHDLTWLDLNSYVTWLDLTKIAMTWLDSRLEYFWLDWTCDSSKGDLLQHCLDIIIGPILLPMQVLCSCWGTESSQMVSNQESIEGHQPVQSHTHAHQPLQPHTCVQEHCPGETGLPSSLFQAVLKCV